MKKHGYTFLFFLLLGVIAACSSGDKRLPADTAASIPAIKYPLPQTGDSLAMLLKKQLRDTDKVNIYNAIGWMLKGKNPDSSMVTGGLALEISRRAGWKKGEANSLGQLGTYFRLKGEYDSALVYLFNALKIDETEGSSRGEAARRGNIGLVYWNEGEYSKALENYFIALRIGEKSNDYIRVSTQLGNIGLVYADLGDFDKALSYHFRALNLDRNLKNRSAVERHLGNIAIAYQRKKDYFLAIDYNERALEMAKALKDNSGIARMISGLGSIYGEQGIRLIKNGEPDLGKIKLDSAIKYSLEAAARAKEIGQKNYRCVALGNAAANYCMLAQSAPVALQEEYFHKSFDLGYQALAISTEIKAKNISKDHYQVLSDLYENSTIPLPDSVNGKMLDEEGRKLRALYYYRVSQALSDSVASQENKEQSLRKQLNFEFEQKQLKTKADEVVVDALTAGNLKEKEAQRNYFIAGFILVLAAAGFVFRGFLQKKKANEIISVQKNELEEKQKEILDSIHYARRIQQAIMPAESYIAKNLGKLNRV